MISLLACELLHFHLFFLTAWKLYKGRYLTAKLLCYNTVWQNIPTERNHWKTARASAPLMGKGCQSHPSPISPRRVEPPTSNPIYKSPAPSRSLEPVRERSARRRLTAACSQRAINHSPHQRRPRRRERAAGDLQPFPPRTPRLLNPLPSL